MKHVLPVGGQGPKPVKGLLLVPKPKPNEGMLVFVALKPLKGALLVPDVAEGLL